MPNYSTWVSATSNAAGGTIDTFVSILAAAGSAIRIKRVRVSIETAASDSRSIVKLARLSTLGAGSTAGTIVKKDTTMRNSSVTTAVKNTTNAFASGTVTDTIDQDNVNGRVIWEWIPRNAAEEIYIAAAAYFGVLITCSANSIVHDVYVEWED